MEVEYSDTIEWGNNRDVYASIYGGKIYIANLIPHSKMLNGDICFAKSGHVYTRTFNDWKPTELFAVPLEARAILFLLGWKIG